jgi:hypothetical protein
MRMKRTDGTIVERVREPMLEVRAAEVSVEPPRRRRTGKKRTRFRVPAKLPVAVRGLWEAASEEERQAAHRLVTAILESWLGKTTREEAAARTGLAPLRFWQQSQAALSGMLAGVLRQPRRMNLAAARALLDSRPVPDVASLKAEVAELRRQLLLAEGLNRLLRELPGHREGAAAGTAARGEKGSARGGPARAAGARAAAASRLRGGRGRALAVGADDPGGPGRAASGPGAAPGAAVS